MLLTKSNKLIFVALFFVIVACLISARRKTKTKKTYKYQIKMHRLGVKGHNLDFVIGLAAGYGLGAEATDDLKKCFIENEQNNNIVINKFIHKAQSMDGKKFEKKEETSSFVRIALDLYAKFKDCNPLRESIFSFIKNRLINIGIKGVAFAVGGPIGLALKAVYDIYKFSSEIKTFYAIMNSKVKDYMKMGSSVGKLIYYAQNLIIKKKLRRLRF